MPNTKQSNNQMKFRDGTYNKAIWLPAELLVDIVGREHRLSYSDHAREQLLNNKLKNPVKILLLVPNPLPVTLEDVVEVSVLSGEPYKVVVRRTADEVTDICLVFNVRTGRVITIWFNSKEDNHQSLDRSQYIHKTSK